MQWFTWIVTITGFIAAYANTKRLNYAFYLWIAINFFDIFVFMYYGISAKVFSSIVYLCISFYGLYRNKKQKKEDEENAKR